MFSLPGGNQKHQRFGAAFGCVHDFTFAFVHLPGVLRKLSLADYIMGRVLRASDCGVIYLRQDKFEPSHQLPIGEPLNLKARQPLVEQAGPFLQAHRPHRTHLPPLASPDTSRSC